MNLDKPLSLANIKLRVMKNPPKIDFQAFFEKKLNCQTLKFAKSNKTSKKFARKKQEAAKTLQKISLYLIGKPNRNKQLSTF